MSFRLATLFVGFLFGRRKNGVVGTESTSKNFLPDNILSDGLQADNYHVALIQQSSRSQSNSYCTVHHAIDGHGTAPGRREIEIFGMSFLCIQHLRHVGLVPRHCWWIYVMPCNIIWKPIWNGHKCHMFVIESSLIIALLLLTWTIVWTPHDYAATDPPTPMIRHCMTLSDAIHTSIRDLFQFPLLSELSA